jgi:hypothetical protein
MAMAGGLARRLLALAALAAAPVLLWAQTDTTYRIVSSRYRLELLPSDKAIRCTDTLGIRLGAGADGSVSFRFFPLYRITGVTVGGRAAPFALERDRLSVRDVPREGTAEIVVEYAGRIPVPTEFAQIGEDRAVFHEEGVVPTGLYDLTYVRGAITVPRGWDALAVGTLAAKAEGTDSVTFVWESAAPLPNLGWICAGVYVRETARDGGLDISTFLSPEDSAAAPAILSRVRDVLGFYGGRFSPYRFPKLAIVEVDNSVAGKNVLAIAAPSFIMVKKFAFETKDVFNQVQSILPHEIAHQWWPATVYVNDEDVALLSEGMCEYSALLYAEASGNMSSRDSLGHHPLLRLLLARVAKGEDQPLRQKADLRALPTHYLKASYVHNMLRAMLGDSLFGRLYAEYAARFALTRATMEDFEGIAERLGGRPLGWFFRQWVTGKGIPRLKIYNVKTAQAAAGAGWLTRGRVRMIGYEKYTALVRVGVETPRGPAGVAVWIGADSAGGYRNDVPFEIRSEGRPTRAILDPDGGLLKIQKIAAKLGELRDRGDGVMIIGTAGGHAAALARLARRDSAAMEASGWSITMKADTASTLADLQREHVFLYGTTRENSVAGDLSGKFPMTCGGDSVVAGGETLRDSSLAIIQAVENPYLASGTLVWVAPLTPAASPELLPYDASWVLVRGNEQIAQGVWDVRDDDLVVTLPP